MAQARIIHPEPGPYSPELRWNAWKVLISKIKRADKAKPTDKANRVGKTMAEIIIYLAVILAWLLLPAVDALWRPRDTPGGWVGVVAALVGVALGAWTVLSCPPSQLS